MRRKRYLEKLELFEKELEFIKSHDIVDDVTERALCHALEVCVDITMDVAAMAIKDMGLVVEDDYTNIEKLEKEGVIGKEEGESIRKFNGLRNAIVHRYDRLDLDMVRKGMKRVDELYEALVKLVRIGDREG